jgi:hypothetical protein
VKHNKVNLERNFDHGRENDTPLLALANALASVASTGRLIEKTTLRDVSTADYSDFVLNDFLAVQALLETPLMNLSNGEKLKADDLVEHIESMLASKNPVNPEFFRIATLLYVRDGVIAAAEQETTLAWSYAVSATYWSGLYVVKARIEIVHPKMRARKAAKARLANDKGGIQASKLAIKKDWDKWKRNPDLYGGNAAFSRLMLERHTNIKDIRTIGRWCTAWSKDRQNKTTT